MKDESNIGVRGGTWKLCALDVDADADGISVFLEATTPDFEDK